METIMEVSEDVKEMIGVVNSNKDKLIESITDVIETEDVKRVIEDVVVHTQKAMDSEQVKKVVETIIDHEEEVIEKVEEIVQAVIVEAETVLPAEVVSVVDKVVAESGCFAWLKRKSRRSPATQTQTPSK